MCHPAVHIFDVFLQANDVLRIQYSSSCVWGIFASSVGGRRVPSPPSPTCPCAEDVSPRIFV